jgi:predicted alpha/beta hydrolase
MLKLPKNIHFDEAQFPGLRDIFREIDTAIATIVASDPAFRPKPAVKRRSRTSAANAHVSRRPRNSKRAAA